MKALVDKLDVKPESRVVVVGLKEAGFRKQLRTRTTDLWESRVEAGSDCIFLGADRKDDLELLGLFRHYMKQDGALWVVYPKGRQEIRQRDVLAAGRKAGLMDIKVVRFSETHTALKFIIRAKRR